MRSYTAKRIGFLLIAAIAAVWLYAAVPPPDVKDAEMPLIVQKVVQGAPLALHFSQWMNRSATESAVIITPRMEGDFSWKDGRTLEFRPASPLAIGDEIRMQVTKKAESLFKKPMKESRFLAFVVTGPPFVEFAYPAPAPEGESAPVIAANQAVTVVFDRPMDTTVLPADILKINPPVETGGQGTWISDRAFTFEPVKWPLDAVLHFTVPAGLAAVAGGRTESAYEWTLKTPPFKVTDHHPAETDVVDLNAPLYVTFSGEVDLDAVRPGKNVLLFPSNDLDASSRLREDGFFNAEITYAAGQSGAPDKTTLVFKPTFPYLPGQSYRLVLKQGLQALGGMRSLAGDFEMSFQTGAAAKNDPGTPSPASETLAWYSPAPAQLFQAGQDPVLKFISRSGGDVGISLCEIPLAVYFDVSEKQGWSSYLCANPGITRPVLAGEAVALNLTEAFGRGFAPGIYLLSVSDAAGRIAQPFIVSNIQLIVKRSESFLLAWAVNPVTGAPIPDLPIALFSHAGEPIRQGKTDENGLWQMNETMEEGLYVVVEDGEGSRRWALVNDLWAPSIPAMQRLLADENRERELYFYADKNVYRPGDKLYFHGFYRERTSGGLALPARGRVSVSMQKDDESSAEALSLKPQLARHGSFYGEGVIPADRTSGRYRWNVTVEKDGASEHFTYPVIVEPATGETAFLSLEGPSSVVDSSQPVRLKIRSGSPGGGAASGAAGVYRIVRRPMVFSPDSGGVAYQVGPWKDIACRKGSCPAEETVAEQQPFILDARGEGEIILDPAKTPLEPGYRYDIGAAVVHPDGRRSEKMASFTVRPGDYFIGLSADRYLLSAGDDLRVRLLAFDEDLRGIPDKKITVALQSAADPRARPVARKTVVTSSEPDFISLSLPSDLAGYYSVSAEGGDNAGRVIRSELQVYIERAAGPASAGGTAGEGVELIPDQPEYLVGGKATLLLVPPADAPAMATALITYRYGGSLHSEPIALNGRPVKIETLIKETMRPALEVTATLPGREGRPAIYRTITLPVKDPAGIIQMDMRARPAAGEDGGHALAVSIAAGDAQNRPASVQVSLLLSAGDDAFSPQSPLDFFNAVPSAEASASGRPETVYFDASLKTDAAGNLGFSIPLPVDFTHGKLTAIASGDAGQFGYARVSVNLKKPLAIQPDLPAFVAPGDTVPLKAVLINTSDQDFETDLELVTPGLNVRGDAARHVMVRAGQTLLLAWIATVPAEAEGSIAIAFRTRETFVSASLPVKTGVYGGLIGEAGEWFLGEGQDMAWLTPFERPAGGFSLWPKMADPDPFGTAYALFLIAQRQGTARDMYAKAIGYLFAALQSGETLGPEERVMLTWVLAELGEFDTRAALTLFKERREIPLYARGLLLLNLHRLALAGQSSVQPFVERLKSEIAAEAVEGPEANYFPGTENADYFQGSLITTSILLFALREVSPDNPLIDPLGRYVEAHAAQSPMEKVWRHLALQNKNDGPNASSAPAVIGQAPAAPLIIERRYTPLGDGLHRGQLTVIVPGNLGHVVVEEPLPAGMRPLSFEPRLTDPASPYKEAERQQAQGYSVAQNPLWHFNHTEITPTGFLLYADRLPAGVYTVQFLTEETLAGRYRHLPAAIYQIFNSTVSGSTQEETIEIR